MRETMNNKHDGSIITLRSKDGNISVNFSDLETFTSNDIYEYYLSFYSDSDESLSEVLEVINKTNEPIRKILAMINKRNNDE